MKRETPNVGSREELEKLADQVVTTFTQFGTPMRLVEAKDGLHAYHFYLQPEKPTRMKAFATFLDDLRYELGTSAVEIEAPLPDAKLVGVRVRKADQLAPIPLMPAQEDAAFHASPLTIPLGTGEFGDVHFADIARWPHALIAGMTGSGKSMLIHTIIHALCAKHSLKTLRFILIDPKQVEFAEYRELPHLLTPPIYQPKKTLRALLWAAKELSRRYEILTARGARDIAEYHTLLTKEKNEEDSEPLPHLLIFIEELSDLMLAYPTELENLLTRLITMGGPVGIHLILATQRPSSSVLTTSIKANIPVRIAFAVASQVDSRTIIDTPGAELLTAPGDFLLQTYQAARPQRLQGFFLSPTERQTLLKTLIDTANRDLAGTLDLSGDSESSMYFTDALSVGVGDEDDLYEDAKQAVLEAGKASTSYLQRKLRIGYSRACRLMDLLEEGGVIGPADGSSPREVRGE